MTQQPNAQYAESGLSWGNEAAAILVSMFENTKVIPGPKGNRGKNHDKQKKYLDILSAFDIETTSLPDIQHAFMYVWPWGFVSLADDSTVVIYGRTWDEWVECISLIVGLIGPGCACVCLVHNLSFEFQFLREYIHFNKDDVFCTEPRSILKATAWDRIEYRCTMRHSNTSLEVYTKQWHVKHQKLSGEEFGYEKVRYPWTELTADELRYAIHDVLGLLEAYRAEMEYWKDTLYTVPLTSTGYVRRICKREWARINYVDRLAWMPKLEVVDILHEAFRGGDTHADRHYSTPEDGGGAIVTAGVQSWDRASSYPDVLVNCEFPLGDWYRLTKKGKWITAEEVERYTVDYHKAVVGRVHFAGLRLKKPSWGMPYLPKDKALFLEGAACDNGRVLSADKLSTTITDVDWEIIKSEYAWDDVYFSDVYYCRYRMLPDFFRDVVRQFFRDKTELKGYTEGTLEETEYNLKKQLLNALYGMAAQWCIKESIFYIQDTGEYVEEIDYELREMEKDHPMTGKQKREYRDQRRREILARHNKKAFLPYSVGVWCTAWARLELHRSMWAVDAAGGTTLYVDTDSNKFINADHALDELNAYYKARSEFNHAAATDRKGKTYYMGVYDHEYDCEFACMGAKKYVYRKSDGQLHITIAGVNKKKGAMELENKGGFSAFHAGTVFEIAGGVKGVYNDQGAGVVEVDGHPLYIGSNVCLLPDTYTLSLADEYARLLDSIAARQKIDGYTLIGGY